MLEKANSRLGFNSNAWEGRLTDPMHGSSTRTTITIATVSREDNDVDVFSLGQCGIVTGPEQDGQSIVGAKLGVTR